MNHGPGKAPSANPGLDDTARASSPSSNLTVAGDVHVSEERARARGGKSPRTGRDGKVQKVCCHCGKDVAHEERFKDRAGYYWCMDCGVAENRQKHTIGHAAPEPATCPDCEEKFQPGQLVETDGVRVCPGCAAKREQAAEREAARQAARKQAALEAYLAAQQRQRRVTIAVVVGAALAVAGAVYVIAF